MKCNLYENGELKRCQHEVIPQGMKLILVEKYRLWLTVPKSWTVRQCETHKAQWLKRYEESLINSLMKF